MASGRLSRLQGRFVMSGIRGFLGKPGTLRVCQIVTGLLFLWAGLAKIGDLTAFAEQLHNYRIVPIWTENLLAMTVPWIEVVAGLALVVGVRARSGAVLATAMLAVFTVAVAAAWARGLDFECGCFGKASAGRIGAQKLLENLGMLALAGAGTLRSRVGAG